MADHYSGAVNMHKRLASGQVGAEKHLKKGGAVKGISGNINDSSQKQALPKPQPHAIATMRRGGRAKK